MNHAGVADTDMLIILNDNCMSIDPNVGALKEYLTDITTSPTYNKVKDDIWKMLGKLPLGANFTRSRQNITGRFCIATSCTTWSYDRCMNDE